MLADPSAHQLAHQLARPWHSSAEEHHVVEAQLTSASSRRRRVVMHAADYGA
jgi:hypothetical protein